MTVAADHTETIRRMHEAWVWGWDKAPDSGPWVFDAVQGDFYDWDAPGRFYDDMDPEHRIIRSPQEYRAAWEPTFNSLRSAEHRIEDGPELEASDDLVVSRLVFIARLVTADGDEIGIRTHNTLIWRQFEGAWKIVGDHTSSVHIESDELEHLMATLRGPAV